ncbi:MAG: S1 RNA-binding domain-containing protein [Lachnospiraceae bacterium]|nr:S1 RNA-binding domain-containing protein [Lachnospiraceae bacterium]
MESMKDFEKELEESYKQLDSDYIEQNEADDDDTWVMLKENVKSGEVINVKIKEAVKGGVIAYIDELRAFIPASQISDTYTEKLDDWVGKHIDVIVTEVDKEKERIILSGKEVIKNRKKAEREKSFEKVKVGDTYEGSVESLQSYGAFVNIGGELSGLVHISQISDKRIKSPRDVLKVGQSVKVKVIKIEEGKISLTMKGLEPKLTELYSPKEVSIETKELTTSLGSLLKGIKL